MNLTDLIAVPGRWLFDIFLRRSEAFEVDVAPELALALGLVFWLALMLMVRGCMLAYAHGWPRQRPRLLLNTPFKRPISNRDRVLGAVWRAQAVHIALYALVPLRWEACRYLFIIALLPLMVIGFGNTTIGKTDGSLRHLAQPACWTFLTFCAGPRSNFLHNEVQNLSECTVERGCPPARSALTDHGGWGWKLLWLAGVAAWLLYWRRNQQKLNTAP